MGLGIMRGSSCNCCGKVHGGVTPAYDPPSERPVPPAPPEKFQVDPEKWGNPDPKRFEILRTAEFAYRTKIATVVEVQYPDAKNYEGKKVMLYACSAVQVTQQKTLDPHFCDDNSHLSPFARFAPTEEGWLTACRLAQVLLKG